MKRSITKAALLSACIFALLTACGSSETTFLPKTEAVIPFTTVGWDATQDDVIALEGVSSEPYDGIYGGQVLVYDKEYLALNGKVLYMFNTDGKIADIAWKLTTDSAETADRAMGEISALLTSAYGSPTFINPDESAAGGKWESGDISILVNKVNVEGIYYVQLAYLNEKTAELGYNDKN